MADFAYSSTSFPISNFPVFLPSQDDANVPVQRGATPDGREVKVLNRDEVNQYVQARDFYTPIASFNSALEAFELQLGQTDNLQVKAALSAKITALQQPRDMLAGLLNSQIEADKSQKNLEWFTGAQEHYAASSKDALQQSQRLKQEAVRFTAYSKNASESAAQAKAELAKTNANKDKLIKNLDSTLAALEAPVEAKKGFFASVWEGISAFFSKLANPFVKFFNYLFGGNKADNSADYNEVAMQIDNGDWEMLSDEPPAAPRQRPAASLSAPPVLAQEADGKGNEVSTEVAGTVLTDGFSSVLDGDNNYAGVPSMPRTESNNRPTTTSSTTLAHDPAPGEEDKQ